MNVVHRVPQDEPGCLPKGLPARAVAAEPGPVRLLVFTSLYPNAAQPRLGLFVEERLRRLVDSGRVIADVIAPVPWFPFRHRRFGAYGAFARVPACEERHGIRILHPRYPVLPKLGMNFAPALMHRALRPVLHAHLVAGKQIDVIDAHYFYPDGVAAVRLGRELGKPVVVTARGSDVNVIGASRAPARRIRQAARSAAAIIAVSAALKERMRAIGIDPARVMVLRNGVDLERFRPLDRVALRARLGLAGPVWLAVGNLVELKGVHITLAALARVPRATLLVAGEGPEESRLRRLAGKSGLSGRVHFLGAVQHEALCEYYNVADATWLASRHEGMPNVVLESLACGTPVVAAPFASASELLCAPEAGEVASERDSRAMLDAWRRLEARQTPRSCTREIASRLGWAPVVEQQCALYARVASAHVCARQGAVS